jgi:hypothetical protein
MRGFTNRPHLTASSESHIAAGSQIFYAAVFDGLFVKITRQMNDQAWLSVATCTSGLWMRKEPFFNVRAGRDTLKF